jgi:hypothetical protein
MCDNLWSVVICQWALVLAAITLKLMASDLPKNLLLKLNI